MNVCMAANNVSDFRKIQVFFLSWLFMLGYPPATLMNLKEARIDLRGNENIKSGNRSLGQNFSSEIIEIGSFEVIGNM